MNILIEKHKRILSDLVNAKVDFLLIGGYAVIYHGYMRTTGDMDIWLRPDNENKINLINVLQKHLTDKSGIEKIRFLDFSDMVAFHIGREPEKIEFLTKISGVNFHEAYEQKVFLPIADFHIPVLHLNDLIVNKLTSARPKDKSDVDELQRINKLKAK